MLKILTRVKFINTACTFLQSVMKLLKIDLKYYVKNKQTKP